MAEVELTEELIATAMAKADARVCVGNPRCFALPLDRGGSRFQKGLLTRVIGPSFAGSR